MDQSPNSIEKQFAAHTGESIDSLRKVEIPSVQEKVGEVAGQQIQATQDDKKKSAAFLDFDTISTKITNLVGSYATSRVTKQLPPVKTQAKLVEKTLKKEQAKLFKQAKKVKNSRRFSAHDLEEIMLQIRQLQKILSELLHAASHRIKELYQQLVLKTT